MKLCFTLTRTLHCLFFNVQFERSENYVLKTTKHSFNTIHMFCPFFNLLPLFFALRLFSTELFYFNTSESVCQAFLGYFFIFFISFSPDSLKTASLCAFPLRQLVKFNIYFPPCQPFFSFYFVSLLGYTLLGGLPVFSIQYIEKGGIPPIYPHASKSNNITTSIYIICTAFRNMQYFPAFSKFLLHPPHKIKPKYKKMKHHFRITMPITAVFVSFLYKYQENDTFLSAFTKTNCIRHSSACRSLSLSPRMCPHT